MLTFLAHTVYNERCLYIHIQHVQSTLITSLPVSVQIILWFVQLSLNVICCVVDV